MTDYYLRPHEPTVKKFYEDRYVTKTGAWIDDHGVDDKGRQYIILSETVFYPNGGGQKGDRGVIKLTPEISKAIGLPEEIPIIDTRKDKDFIRHHIGVEIPTEIMEKHIIGVQKFEIEIQWSFRYLQMRHHTIAHLLHIFIEKELGKEIEYPSYSELMEDFGVNRYPIENMLTQDQFQHAVSQLNNWMAEDHHIDIYQNEDPSKPDWFRWWECNKWKIPCGGVHPNNTNEVGQFTAKLKCKQGNTSMTFQITE